MYTNGDRIRALKGALSSLTFGCNSPKGILGNMPENVDPDLWEQLEALESAIAARIEHVSTMDWEEAV